LHVLSLGRIVRASGSYSLGIVFKVNPNRIMSEKNFGYLIEELLILRLQTFVFMGLIVFEFIHNGLQKRTIVHGPGFY
jgi:hypothetical protein